MKAYRTTEGPLLEHEGEYYLVPGTMWDAFINDDLIFKKLPNYTKADHRVDRAKHLDIKELMPPIQSQELWGCGVTYARSKQGRQEESKDAAGAAFYARAYEAERPEVFFKCNAHRVVGHGGKVRIRSDSTWDVPEPELTLAVTSSGRIIGYTIGNDMSSRSIEGENPLYLPQAKTYDGCASLGPAIYLIETDFPRSAVVELSIVRAGRPVFEGQVGLDQLKRTYKELVSFVFRECTFPNGCLVMTGTGIVPSSGFTLQKGDEIRITIEPIGTLVNIVGQ